MAKILVVKARTKIGKSFQLLQLLIGYSMLQLTARRLRRYRVKSVDGIVSLLILFSFLIPVIYSSDDGAALFLTKFELDGFRAVWLVRTADSTAQLQPDFAPLNLRTPGVNRAGVLGNLPVSRSAGRHISVSKGFDKALVALTKTQKVSGEVDHSRCCRAASSSVPSLCREDVAGEKI